VFKSFRSVVICSGVLAVVCFCIGLTLSYALSTPAGASVVLVDLAAYILFCAIQKIREKL
jgi:zinc transport system permease protein